MAGEWKKGTGEQGVEGIFRTLEGEVSSCLCV